MSSTNFIIVKHICISKNDLFTTLCLLCLPNNNAYKVKNKTFDKDQLAL